MAKRDLIAIQRFNYATRRLMPGDGFQAKERDARLLVALKRARYGRPAATIGAPPAAVVAKARAVAPPRSSAEDTFKGFLDRPIAAILPELADLGVDELQKHLGDERRGKNRRTLVEAIEAELEKRDPCSRS